jgi:hypothetical protein
MKIRNGFVSNSSSSSFVCDVCGETESGMDASAHDFDMETCSNGHTFCNDHCKELPKPNPNSIRADIINQINSATWLNVNQRQKELDELKEVGDEDIEEFYKDNYSDDGVPACQCPICSMIVVSDSDGYAYLKKKHSLKKADVLDMIRVEFKTYDEFKKYIKPSKSE